MNDDVTPNGQAVSRSRRHFLRAAALSAGSTLLAACGPSIAGKVKIPPMPTLAPNVAQATVTASVGKSYFPSGDPNVPDAYTVPPPLVQSVPEPPGRGGVVRVFTITYQPPATPEEQNAFWLELNRRMRVDFHVLSASGGDDSYAQKSGSLLASGDLPDIYLMIPSSTPALIPAIQQGAFADLTDYVMGDAVRQFPNLATIPPGVWKGIAVDGRIYGIPRTRPWVNNVLMFRYDWLKKLNLPLPKNADDFYNMLLAFTKGHPNGPGKQSWGLGALNGCFSFIQQMYRVPNNWRLENDGSLTPSFATDEYKQAFTYLIKLFKAGIFHPDSLTQNTTQAKNGLISGQFGGYFDGILGTIGERTGAKKLDPQSDAAFLVPFAADGGKPMSWLSSGNFGFAGFPADAAKDPARLRELLGIMNYFTAPQLSAEGIFIKYGIDGWDNKKKSNGVRTLTPTGQKELQDIWGFGNGVPIWYFPDDPPFGPRMMELTKQTYQMGIQDPTLGLISKTNIKQGPSLSTLRNDAFLRILKGNEPVSAGVDAMYKDWLNNGGAQIRQEYMDQLQKK